MRLDGDEMPADADDGEPGHFSAAVMRLRRSQAPPELSSWSPCRVGCRVLPRPRVASMRPYHRDEDRLVLEVIVVNDMGAPYPIG